MKLNRRSMFNVVAILWIVLAGTFATLDPTPTDVEVNWNGSSSRRP